MKKEKTKPKEKTIESDGDMIREISSGIRRIEIQNDVLRKLIDELNQKTNKKTT